MRRDAPISRLVLLLVLVSALAPRRRADGRGPARRRWTRRPITDEDRRHWSFVPPGRPELPPVRDEGWVRNPIDRFILAGLEANGLSHAPEADRTTLLRRLSFDLIGLPPTPEEVDAFLADDSPRRLRELRSIACWPARITASAGRSTGSTWPAMPIPTASSSTRRGPTPGGIATGSSGALNDDMPYDTLRRASSSRATRSGPTTPPRSSPPASIAATPTWWTSTTRGSAGRTP